MERRASRPSTSKYRADLVECSRLVQASYCPSALIQPNSEVSTNGLVKVVFCLCGDEPVSASVRLFRNWRVDRVFLVQAVRLRSLKGRLILELAASLKRCPSKVVQSELQEIMLPGFWYATAILRLLCRRSIFFVLFCFVLVLRSIFLPQLFCCNKRPAPRSTEGVYKGSLELSTLCRLAKCASSNCGGA
jgi:hypothetical protein